MARQVCRALVRPRRRWTMAVACAVLGAVWPLVAELQAQSGQAPAGAAPPAGETITIAQAVDEAIAHNLDLIAKRADVSVAQAQIITAQLRPNPVLSLDANHLDWLGTGFNDVNSGGPTEFGAHVDFVIERGQKRDLRIGQATAARDVAEAQVAEAIRTLRSEVELACIDVMQATQNLSLTRDALQTFADLARMNDDRVRAGAAPPSEAARTQVAMLQFKANVSRAELALRTASIQLRHVLGRPQSSTPLDVTGPPIDAAAMPPLDLKVLESLAYDHRTDLRAAQLTEARSAADVKLQLAIGKVDFSVGTEYRRQTGHAGPKSNSLGLFFSTPLPFSNRNQGEIARAGAEKTQAHLQAAATEESIRADLQSAFESYQASGALVAGIERDLLGPARSARDTAEYTYRARATTLVELIDAQRAWNDAMQTYYDAQADYRRAIARLNAAVGMEVVR